MLYRFVRKSLLEVFKLLPEGSEGIIILKARGRGGF